MSVNASMSAKEEDLKAPRAWARASASAISEGKPTVSEVVVVLLDVVLEAVSWQRAIADGDDERVLDVGVPQREVGLDQVGGEGVRVEWGWSE
jgi:hypothetical protein